MIEKQIEARHLGFCDNTNQKGDNIINNYNNNSSPTKSKQKQIEMTKKIKSNKQLQI